MILADILLLQISEGFIKMLPLILMIPVFYFFMMRPQMKRQKEQVAFGDSLQKGMEIVTTGGIVGRINKLEDNFVTLELEGKTYMKVARNFISKENTEAYTKGVSINERNNG